MFSGQAAEEQREQIKAQESGGGFLVDDADGGSPVILRGGKGDGDGCSNQKKVTITGSDGASDASSWPQCVECGARMPSPSFLTIHFDLNVCDSCRDDRGKHIMITKTTAKETFLLKDCDLDLRDPPLKCLLKKNPHEMARNDMKLYLKLQVEERAALVHGSLQEVTAMKNKRKEDTSKRKKKQFDKKIVELRKSLKPLIGVNDKPLNHVHDFGPETCVNEDTDEYEKTCSSCGFVSKFEKL